MISSWKYKQFNKSISSLGNAAFLHIRDKKDMFFVRRTSGSSFKNKDEARLCTILGQKEEIIRFANDLVVRVNCSNYLSTRQWKVTYCHEWSFQRIVQLRTSEFFSSRFFQFFLGRRGPNYEVSLDDLAFVAL